jgi:hypothetical protein
VPIYKCGGTGKARIEAFIRSTKTKSSLVLKSNEAEQKSIPYHIKTQDVQQKA